MRDKFNCIFVEILVNINVKNAQSVWKKVINIIRYNKINNIKISYKYKYNKTS